MKTEFNIQGIYSYRDLLQRLQEGARLCKVETYRDGTRNLCTVCSANTDYIHWRNYGESANRATPQGMQFVVEVIFRMSLPEFIRAFVWA